MNVKGVRVGQCREAGRGGGAEERCWSEQVGFGFYIFSRFLVLSSVPFVHSLVLGSFVLVGRQGPGVSLTAVTTMLKMMKNMSANFKEDKFKRIRLGNANFNSKVGGIDGGLEVRFVSRRFLFCSLPRFA